MNTFLWRLVGAVLAFLAVLLSGIRLSRSGRPFNGAVLTVHKLISLAAGILLVITLYQMSQTATSTTNELIAGLITGLSLLVAGITGGLLRTDKSLPPTVLRAHQATSLLSVLSAVAFLYLLQKNA